MYILSFGLSFVVSVELLELVELLVSVSVLLYVGTKPIFE